MPASRGPARPVFGSQVRLPKPHLSQDDWSRVFSVDPLVSGQHIDYINVWISFHASCTHNNPHYKSYIIERTWTGSTNAAHLNPVRSSVNILYIYIYLFIKGYPVGPRSQRPFSYTGKGQCKPAMLSQVYWFNIPLTTCLYPSGIKLDRCISGC